MFAIIKEGITIAIVSKPYYVKKDGVLRGGIDRFLECDKEQAEGLAINGKLYNLLGKELKPGLEEVYIAEIDAGSLIHKLDANQMALAELLIDVKYKQILIDLGVSENA